MLSILIFFLGQLSLGTLRDLGDNDTASFTPGIYIMPQSVESCGRLVHIEAKGFVKSNSDTNQTYRMLLLVYEKICSDGTYNESYRKSLRAETNNNSSEFSISCDVVDLVHVNRDSLIGVRVRRICNENNVCPFTPIIRLSDGDNIQKPVLHAGNSLDNLEEMTGYFLNMEAIIIGNLISV